MVVFFTDVWRSILRCPGLVLVLSLILDCSVVWMVSILPLVSTSSSFFSRPLGTVRRAPTTISTNVTFFFHSFFTSLIRSRYYNYYFTPCEYFSSPSQALWTFQRGPFNNCIFKITLFHSRDFNLNFFDDYLSVRWNNRKKDLLDTLPLREKTIHVHLLKGSLTSYLME